MKRTKTVFLLCMLMLFVCSVRQSNAQRRQPITFSTEEQSKKVAGLKLGEASGTIKGVGGTVRLRYAYARWVRDARDANENMIELLLTEKAIPKDKLAFVFAGHLSYRPIYQELGEAPRGLKLFLKRDGSMYQKELLHFAMSESGMLQLKEFELIGDRLTGVDEERGSGIGDERWGYSVSFIASVGK